MYKKLMFLISLVVLLGLSAGARAADLEVDAGETVTISVPTTVGDFEIKGTLIVTSTLTATGESSIDGDDGGAGELIINGGTVDMQARLNIGTDHQGYIIINDGGSLIQGCCGSDWEDGIKFPDNEGGEHRIIINDGTVHAHAIEQKHDRDAKFEIGCDGLLLLDEVELGEGDYDPTEWEGEGDLGCSDGNCGLLLIGYSDCYEDDGDDYCAASVSCIELPEQAWNPSPADGAIHQKVSVVMTWNSGKYVGYPPLTTGRHLIYFGDDEAAIEAIPAGNTSSPYFRGFVMADDTLDFDPADAALTLELWETYFWRIDEYNKVPDPPEAYTKGNVWSFTTGCELDGDINLDCLLNFEDYAMLADDWGVEVLFPDDVEP